MAGVRRGSATLAVSPPKDWMTSGEVARALNMTRAAIRRWAREGLVDAIKTPGGQYRFRREALVRLMDVKRINRNGDLDSRRRSNS
jgi:excisionase family DNA binding protein